MLEPPKCPECGTPLPLDSPEGICPKCLLLAGLASEPAATIPSPGQADAPRSPGHDSFTPPTLEEIALAFPQLEVLELIGRGGMGAVYKARQRELDRLVALKILPPEVGRDPAFAQRFAREARALARLNHPHIVTIFDSGQSGGLYYLMMEYVDGVNLRQTIRAGEMAPAEALAIVPQICDALQYAHDEGIVHRDIKPENILVDKRGRVKIADFGLAKLLASGGRESPESASRLTATAQVMGTLRYMAPEQMQSSAEVDHRADIYSLGVVFYELLTGEVPMGRFEPPSQRAAVDARLDDIVLRTLEREPRRRYQQASEVKTDVQTVASSPNAKLPPRASIAATAAADLDAVRQEVSVPGLALVCLGVLYFGMSFLLICIAPTAYLLMPVGGQGVDAAPRYDVAPSVSHDEHDDHVTLPAAESHFAQPAAIVFPWASMVAAQGVIFAQAGAPQAEGMVAWPMALLTLLAIGMLFQWPLSVVMIVGGWRMRRLESHGLAVLASIFALLPCQPLFMPLGLVIGIWSLIVLNRPHIKAAFAAQRKRGGPVTAVASGPTIEATLPANRGNLEPLIVQALGHGKIEAIRVYRKATHAGLAEAKSAVESIAAAHGMHDLPPSSQQRLRQIALPAAALATAAGVISATGVNPVVQGIVVVGGAALLLIWYVALWRALRRERAAAASSADDPTRWWRRITMLAIVGVALLAAVGGAYYVARAVQLQASRELPIAVRDGDERRVRELLGRGADVNAKDADGNPAIVIAAMAGDHTMIHLLDARGAIVDARNAQGRTALMEAAARGHLFAVAMLNSGHAQPHLLDNDGHTAFHAALLGGHKHCAQELSKRAGDAGRSRKDALGRPMLSVAAAHCPSMVSEIIQATGGNVDERDTAGMTPLMHAAWAGHAQAINVLIVNSADMNATDHNGRTPLDWAVFRDQRSAVKLLLEKGAQKTALVQFWEGYHLALKSQFAEAAIPLKAAVDELPIAATCSFQAGRELFQTTHPKQFALIALAECELRAGNTMAASQHFAAAEELQGAQTLVLYTRFDLSPQQLATGIVDNDNYHTLQFTLSPEALAQAAGDSPQAPMFDVKELQVTTTDHAGLMSRSESTSNGTTRGLFAR